MNGIEPLRLGGFSVDGISVGGHETYIRIRDLGLCFDIGRAPEDSLAVETVLFTHSHIDHLGGVISHVASRALRGMCPPTYVVSPLLAPKLEELLDLWRKIDGGSLPCNVVPLGPGDELVYKGHYRIRPFAAPHFGPAQGYAIWSSKQKLRTEFIGKSGPEVAQLRKSGVQVTEAHDVPLISFTGDARSEVFDVEVVRKARLSIFETTFVDDRVSVAAAREKGHIHIDEVIARADDFESEAILMTHFSARYNARQVREALAERLPESLRDRVTPFLHHFRP